MSFELFWKEGALRDLGKLEIFMRKRIVKKVLEFVEVGSFHGVRRMAGYDNMYRLRVGFYRVIFEMIDGGIVVLKVGRRKNIY